MRVPWLVVGMIFPALQSPPLLISPVQPVVAQNNSFRPRFPSIRSRTSPSFRLVASLLLVLTLSQDPSPAYGASATPTTREQVQQQHSWQLGNGKVEISDPLVIDELELRQPKLLGSGGGGSVFAMTQIGPSSSSSSSDRTRLSDAAVAVKISWQRSAESVKNECRVLQALKDSRVSGVEICLGQTPYPSDPSRIMIALQPVFTDAVVNSVTEVQGAEQQSHAVQSIITTMMQMLAARTVTTDVQPLISAQTGDVLLIDLTEAKMVTATSISLIDLSLASSFVSEMLSLVPESLHQVAAATLWHELQNVGDRLPIQFCAILRDQSNSLLLPETIEAIERCG